MNPEYALLTLKNEKDKLNDLLKNGHLLPKQETKIKHQLWSLEFGIELLETYED